ncbi:MAG TPA: hypothetical protein VGK99_07840 [Acidobacteriota bacterium]|jgi:hypothetical protein
MTRFTPFNFTKAKTYPLKSRKSKVSASDFASLPAGAGFSEFLTSIPSILAGKDLRSAAEAVVNARRRGKPVIWGLGGHVIKVGLAPLLIDLAARGALSLAAMNGSAMIHDFEVGLCGATSEDVPDQLEHGEFGMADETGIYLNRAARRAREEDTGLGEALIRELANMELPFRQNSLLGQARDYGVSITGHLAIGTDITHIHPSADGESLGRATFRDFQIFTSAVKELNEGGVYINAGSAVILPEIFLKAVSVVRNCGHALKNFTTINLDFIQHYRPTQNVIRRPVMQGGIGIALTGHHEILIPLLAAMLRERMDKTVTPG